MSLRGLCLGLMVVLVCLWGVRPTYAQVCPGSTSGYIPVDYEELTIGAVAVGLTSAKIPVNPVNTLGMAFITIETNAISYLFTGTPTATLGHQASAGTSLYLCGPATMRAFRAIQISGAAKVKISYFRSE